MKNVRNSVSAMAVVIGLAASASVSADDVNSVVQQVESNGSVVSNQNQFAPVTIQDVINDARSESVAEVQVNSKSVSQINSVADRLGSPAKL
jgi:type 1 fimbria pilin